MKVLFFVLVIIACSDKPPPKEAVTAETLVTSSLKNSPFIGKGYYNRQKLQQYLRANPAGLGPQRLSAGSHAELKLELAKLANKALAAEAPISAEAKLELALDALQRNQRSLCEFYLAEISDQLPAAVDNTRALLAWQRGQIPEALELWNQALKADPDYEAAELNLSLALRKFGFQAEILDPPWLQTLLTATPAAGAQACVKLIAEHKRNPLVLYNCALYQWRAGQRQAAETSLRSFRGLQKPAAWAGKGRLLQQAIRKDG